MIKSKFLLLDCIVNMHLNFTEATQNSKNQGPVIWKLQKWTLSNEGSYKINVDGATSIDSHSVGVGIVVRNDEGEVMVPMSKPIR